MGAIKIFQALFWIFVLEDCLFCNGDEHVFNSHGQAEKPPCTSNAHVCTSIMKYADGHEFDEGPYCKCSGGQACGSEWKYDDFKSVSWPHFERADKVVQYKFCIPIIPNRVCEPDDLAITIATSTGDWSPHVKDARCMCPGHLYELLGWWRHPTHKHDNKTGVWIYEYFCGKDECVDTKMPCAKIYVDPHSKHHNNGESLTVGYNFLCACPRGYKCPDKDDDEEDPKLETDFRGKYIPRYCEHLHGNKH